MLSMCHSVCENSFTEMPRHGDAIHITGFLRGETRFFAVFLLLTLRSCWTKLICRWFKTPWRSCYVIVLYIWGKPKKSKTLVHLLPSKIYFVFIIQIALQFFLSYCFIHVYVWLWDRVICPLRGIYVHHRLGCGTSLHSGWISSQQGYHTLITKILGPTWGPSGADRS